MAKHLTIVLITEKTSKVKKIRIPINLLFFFSVVLIGILSFTGYVFHYYYTDSQKILQIDELQDIYSRKSLKIDTYFKDLEKISLDFDRLNETRKKMKSLTGLELPQDANIVANTQRVLLKKYYDDGGETILNIIGDVDNSESEAGENNEEYIAKYIAFNEENIFSYPFASPSDVPAEGMTLTGFRYETDPFTPGSGLLNGITVWVKSPDVSIYATAGGVVTKVGKNESMGEFVEIKHNFAFSTRYSFLGTKNVFPGDIIKKGQEIAKAGEGKPFEVPHFHYEVFLFDIPQNPNKYRSDEYLEDIIRN